MYSSRHLSFSRLTALLAVVTVTVLIALLAVVPPAHAYDSDEVYFLTLINNYRAGYGLSPLTMSITLCNSSEGHSYDMAINNFFSHTGSNGSSFSDRIRAAGYFYNTSMGENIAAGYADAQSVFNAWRNSPSHDENMLSPNYHAIGIGRVYGPGSQYGWYWTTDFGGVSDASVQILPFRLVADASNPTGVYYVEGSTKRAVPPGVYNSWGFARYPIDYIDHQSFAGFTTGADLTKLISAGGSVYYVDRGEKKWITDPNLFNIWGFDWNSITPVLPATLNSLHTGPNLSLLVQPEGTGSVYLVDNGARHPLTSPDLLQHLGYPLLRDVSVISGDYPLSDAAALSGFTIKGSGPEKYVMGSGLKRLIPSDTVLNLWNLGGSTFTQLADSTISNLYSGPDLSGLGQTYGQGEVYLLEAGAKRHIVDYDSFSHWGFAEGAIFRVSSQVTDAFNDGAPLTRLMSHSGSTYLVENANKRQLTNFASLDAESLWHYGLNQADVQAASQATFDLLGAGTAADLKNSNLVLRSGRVYYIDAGKKRAVRDQQTFDQWAFSESDVITPFNNSGIDSYPEGESLTQLAANNGRAYLVQSGVFRHIADADTFNIFKDNWGAGWGDIKPMSDSLRASRSDGPEITFPRLVTYSSGGPVYFMDSDGKRPIQNPFTFNNWGFSWSDILYTRNNAFLAGYPSPNPLSVLAVSPQGAVYLISNGQSHHIASPDVFNAHAASDPVYDWNNIFPVSNEALDALQAGDEVH